MIRKFTTQIGTLATLRNQRWRLTNAEIKGFGGKCFDVVNGVLQPMQQVNLVDCNGTAAQRFELVSATGPNSEEYQLRVMGTNLCALPANSNVGASLRLETCPTSGNRHYFFRDNGPIRFATLEGRCLAVNRNDPNVDMSLTLQNCHSSSADNISRQKQQFFVSGNIQSDLGTCLTASGRSFVNGVPTITGRCSRHRRMIWDYYWRQGR